MPTFPDQVHLDQIAEALWRKSPLGNAALMVGAGMSRNARNITNPNTLMPTWNELAQCLCEKLYPADDKSITRQRHQALTKAYSTSGALRLSQEFEASFGRTELNRLLKAFTPDDDYTPSDLHVDLLKMPWADVFTTNWDTLLERAVDPVYERRYDVVRSRDDIPASQQPRIVKLHGSFPSNYPFIFTEEDYRSYPVKFAHFVNMVQQSMMENLFCLIGFSGDDPNFLHWSGWVKDNLGTSAPKIYLVGWLELLPVQRRMLEDRNVVPVDLSRIPKDQKEGWPEECLHRYSLEWFLWMLKLKRPPTWNTTSTWESYSPKPPDYLNINPALFQVDKGEKKISPNSRGAGQESKRLEELRSQVVEWKSERNNYQGWVIAPERVRNFIWMFTQHWIREISELHHLIPPWERLFTLRELVWRLEVCLAPLFSELTQPLSQVLKDIDPNSRKCLWDEKEVQWSESDWPEARKAWFEVAVTLLRSYRHDNLPEQFALLASRIEALKGCPQSTDSITYERAMFALQDMDYTNLFNLLKRWHVENSDHIWAIRKGSILFEIEEFETAYNLLGDTLPLIRRSISRDKDDFFTLSLEGCAMYLLESAGWQRGQKEIKEIKEIDSANNPDWMERWKSLLVNACDIRDEWRSLCTRLNAEPPDPRTERVVKERGFDLGHISPIYQSSGLKLLPAFQVILFTEKAGFPAYILSRSIIMNVGAIGMEKAALWLRSVDLPFAIRILLRTCTSESDKTLKKVVTREMLALLDKDNVEQFINTFILVIEQLTPEMSSDKKHIGKLRVALELLSRLTLRLADQKKLKVIFDLAISLFHNREISCHHWLSRPVTNLLKRVVECFEAHAYADLLLPLLQLSTESKERFNNDEPWWKTIEQGNGHFRLIRKNKPHELDEIISRLLSDAVKEKNREKAIFRLTILHDSGILKEKEQKEFASVLWAKKFLQSSSLPGHTTLYPWVFFILPEPEKGRTEHLIRKLYLTKNKVEKIHLESYFDEFGIIMDGCRRNRIHLLLSPEEDSIVKSMIKKWASEEFNPPSRLFLKQEHKNKELQKLIGIARLLPFLALSREEAAMIQARIVSLENSNIACFILYPPLLSQHPELEKELIIRLKTAMIGDDEEFATFSFQALFFWLSLTETEEDAPPPSLGIADELGGIISMRHEPALSHALLFASHLFKYHAPLAKEIEQKCIQGLEHLFTSCDYQQAVTSGLAERVDIPLIRKNCVELAVAMRDAGYSDNIILMRWIEIAKNDPLPELRNLVARRN